MKKKGWPLVFIFVIIILIALAYLTYWQFQLAREVQLEEHSMTAPVSFFLNSSQSQTIDYHGHTIAITYVSSSPTQKIEAVVDGDKKIIERERTACTESCGEYWSVDSLSLRVEPVIWVNNSEGKLVWNFETWDTDEIYFEANYASPASTGGKFL